MPRVYAVWFVGCPDLREGLAGGILDDSGQERVAVFEDGGHLFQGDRIEMPVDMVHNPGDGRLAGPSMRRVAFAEKNVIVVFLHQLDAKKFLEAKGEYSRVDLVVYLTSTGESIRFPGGFSSDIGMTVKTFKFHDGVIGTYGGGADRLAFGEDINPEDLWFVVEYVYSAGATVSWLVVGIVGTDDFIKIHKKFYRKVVWAGRETPVDEMAASIPFEDRKLVETDGKKQWYSSRSIRITRLDHKVKVVILWKSQHEAVASKIIITNQLNWEVKRIVGAYRRRWTGTEAFHRDGKRHLGLGDGQLRSGEGQTRHTHLVFLAYSLLLPQMRGDRANRVTSLTNWAFGGLNAQFAKVQMKNAAITSYPRIPEITLFPRGSQAIQRRRWSVIPRLATVGQ